MVRALLALRIQRSASAARSIPRYSLGYRAASTRSLTTDVSVAEPSPVPASPFVRAFRIAAVGTVAIAAVNVMPAVDAMAVPQSLALLNAKDGLLVRSGGNRISAAVRRRPERREDYIRQGACRQLATCALRDRFHDDGLSSEVAALEVRRTRDVLYEALGVLVDADDGKNEVLAITPFMRLIEADASESSAARVLHARLIEAPGKERQN